LRGSHGWRQWTFVQRRGGSAAEVWGGKGTGQRCSGCGRPITAADVEYEVDLPGARLAMRLHQPCLEAWDQQRTNFPPKDFPRKMDAA
jgi:hypothetical protein